MKTKTEIIVIHEGVAKSWARDASTFALAVGLIGLGWALNSSAMQWVGAFVWFVTMMAKARGVRKNMTVAEARQRLDEIEKGGGND